MLKTSMIDRHVGERIRRQRFKNRMNTYVFAERIGIAERILVEIESGDLRADAAILIKISRSFGVNIRYFFESLVNLDNIPAATTKLFLVPEDADDGREAQDDAAHAES